VFQFLHRFEVDVWDIKSFAGIESLSRNLKFLGIGATKSKAHSLDFLSSFPQLEELYIEGHTKNIEAISGLKTLQKLTLRSVTLPNPDVLIPLKSLWWFALKLGGTKDLTKLPEVGHLKYLEIWMVKGLIDLDPISEVVSLQYLFLQALKRVTRLPSFKKLINLRRLHLQTMKGLNDLNPIIDSTSLEELVVCDAPHMKPQDFDVLVDHPSLKRVLVGLGSDKKNNAVNQKLPLGSINGFSMFDFEFI
jgi:Leucine-rich repeat (LRR) protein